MDATITDSFGCEFEKMLDQDPELREACEKLKQELRKVAAEEKELPTMGLENLPPFLWRI